MRSAGQAPSKVPVMERQSWCLYLPGVCIHVVPSSMDSQGQELHHEPAPSRSAQNITFHPYKIPSLQEHPLFRSSLHSNNQLASHYMELDLDSELSSPMTPDIAKPTMAQLTKLTCHDKAFENTSTSVAASQMRNALNNLADTVTDPEEKKVRCQNFLSFEYY